MRRWKPRRGLGLWIGLILLVPTVAGIGWLGSRLIILFSQVPEQWQFNLVTYGEILGLLLLLLLFSILIYRILGGLTLSYAMDRNGLYIVWMGNRAVVPLGQIESLDKGTSIPWAPWMVFRNIGYYWGRGNTTDGRTVHLFTTISPTRSLLIYTATDAYAISPADQEAFVQELEQRRRLGAVKPLAPTVEPGRVFFYAFWNDPVVRWALLFAFALNLVLLGILAARYPELAAMINMRFNSAGQVTELRPRHQVLFLPLAAFVVSLLNAILGLSFYKYEKMSAQLLQLGSILVQVLFGIAVLTIIG